MSIVTVVALIIFVGWLISRRENKQEREIEKLESKLDEIKEANSPYRGMSADERADIAVDVLLYDRQHKKD